jgi:protein required for attachment to host cells
MHIHHNDWVLIADGRKALFLVNKGDAELPNLETLRVMEQENPATSEQGTERPGRTHASAGTARSAYEQTDWHQIEETRFAKELAETLYTAAHKGRFKRLIVVAPPTALGDLRKAFHQEVRGRIAAEVNQDLTNMSIDRIEHHLAQLTSPHPEKT